MADEHDWVVNQDVAKVFTQINDKVVRGELDLLEAIDRVRELPDFPLSWRPGDNIKMRIRRDSPKLITLGSAGRA